MKFSCHHFVVLCSWICLKEVIVNLTGVELTSAGFSALSVAMECNFTLPNYTQFTGKLLIELYSCRHLFQSIIILILRLLHIHIVEMK